MANDQEKELKKIRKILDNLKHGSFVRFKANSDNFVFKIFSELQAEYSLFRFSKLMEDKDTVHEDKTLDEISKDVFKIISVTKDNIAQLVKERVEALTPDTDLHLRAMSKLEEYV